MKKAKKLDAKGYRKFGMRDKLAYAAGDFGCNMSFALKGTVQTFWLVFMMMETGLLSILLLIVQIWDAVNDPMIGSMIDKDTRKYKRGKFKTYILIGACGLLFAGAAVFLPFPGANTIVKAVLFVVGYIIWDACYTVANVPYGSMLSLITEDNAERAQLSTWRSVGSMVGNMVPMIILPMLIWQNVTFNPDDPIGFFRNGGIEIPETLNEADYMINPLTKQPYEIGDNVLNPLTGDKLQILRGENVFYAALIMGVLGFIAFLFMIKNTTIRVDENSVKTNEGEKFNIFKAFGNFLKNRPAVGATLAAMGMFLGMQSASTANTIMFATYFGKADLSGVVMLIGFLPMFIFMPFVKKIVNKWGKKEASVVGSFVSLIGAGLMFLFPTIGDKNLALIIYMGALVVFGLGMGIYSCVSWALMGDAIDYNEWKTGRREEGTVYSLHSFFRKLAQGVGPSAVLLVMGYLGYNSKLGTIGQSESTAKNMCWLVAALYTFSALLMFIGIALIYNLSKKKLAKMQEELAARNVTTENAEEDLIAAETLAVSEDGNTIVEFAATIGAAAAAAEVAETISEETVVETPAEDAPAEETPAEETPAEEAPAEEAPAEEAPAEETPAEEVPAEETPAEETPAEEAPAEETPAEETPAEEAPAEETPAEETHAEEAPAEETPAEETPAEEAPAEEAPAEEAPAEETPAE